MNVLKRLEHLVGQCQQAGGLPRCYLNENTSVKCPYMSERHTEMIRDRMGNPNISIYYGCTQHPRPHKPKDFAVGDTQ